MTDARGEITWASQYKAWGNVLRAVAAQPARQVLALVDAEAAQDAVEEAQPIRFLGQYHNSETGLHYNRFRYYDADIGRYVSLDPIGLAGGSNSYQYAPNPSGWADPLGLSKVECGCGGANASQAIAKVNYGRSPYSEINGAVGEFQGYDNATKGLGHVGIQAPGKTSVPGRADYVTLGTAGDGTINVWDAKYRAPNNTSYPKSIPDAKLAKWMPQVENSVRNMPLGPAKDMAIDALVNGRVVTKIFKWPQ